MRRRCRNIYRKGANYYVLRGITICDRWLGEDGFTNFILDMDWKPEEDLSLDRIDCNGNYTPENCRWATAKQQSNNKRDNYPITINGVTKNVIQWANEYNIPDTTLWNRIKRGWTGEKLIQHQQKRLNLIEIKDEIKSLAQWSKDTDIPESTIRNRINAGWPIDNILTKQ
jgi:hypothetical protein